tara:strand:+ start:1141 stop:1878 length:738 start_codon:yes stop_codon:yes gene_type:complete
MYKFSIVMVCKNSQQTIEKSIDSFLSQTYKNKELIVIDGGSEDGTLKILQKYSNDIFFENIKGLGLYASINLGIRKSSGDLIGLLHSDDQFYDENVLEKISGKFNEDLDAIYTNIVFFKKENKFTRAWNVGQINSLSIKKGIYPPHTGLFVKKKIFENIGFYNENFKISSDIEFMHKLFENEKLKKSALYINSIKMKIGGLSTKSPINIIKSNYEVYKILKSLNVDYPIIMIMKKILIKIKQFFI